MFDFFAPSKQTSTSESTTAPPPWLLKRYQKFLKRAEDVSKTPYEDYTGQRVAGFTPDQEAGFQSVRDAQGLGQPYYDAAFQSAQAGAAPVTWQDIQKAYNPWIDSQVSKWQNDFGVMNDRELAGTNSNAAKMSALTGDRSQVARVLTSESQRRQQDPLIAQMRAQAGQRAEEMAASNRDAAARGAQIYSTLGNQATTDALRSAEAQLATGGLQQQYDQANLDVPYQNWLQSRAYPFQTAQWYGGMLGAVGPNAGSTNTGTSTQPGPSQFSQFAGAGVALVGGLGKAGMLSDERVKEDVAPIGTSFDGQPIYRFRYAGDPKTQIGLIAQDVEKTHPEAVGHGPGGLKMVDYDVATRDAVMSAGGPTQGVGMESSDPDFDRLAGNLGRAIETVKGKMSGGRVQGSPMSGGSSSGLGGEYNPQAVMGGAPSGQFAAFKARKPLDETEGLDRGPPIPGVQVPGTSAVPGFAVGGGVGFNPGSLAFPGNRSDIGFVPTVNIAPGAGLPLAQAPPAAMPQDTSSGDSLSALGALGGKYLSGGFSLASGGGKFSGGRVDGGRSFEDERGGLLPRTASLPRVPGMSVTEDQWGLGRAPEFKLDNPEAYSLPFYSDRPSGVPGTSFAYERPGGIVPTVDVSPAETAQMTAEPLPGQVSSGPMFLGARGAQPASGTSNDASPANDELYDSLIAAGGTMMASKNPNLLGPVGEGVLTGLQTYLKSREATREAALRERQIEAMAQRYADASSHRSRSYDLDARRVTETERHNREMEARKVAPSSVLDREKTKAAVKRVEEMKDSYGDAENMIGSLQNLRAARAEEGWEGPVLNMLPNLSSSAQRVNSIAEDVRLNMTQKTKGAISDSEMRIFGLATPGMGMDDDAADKVMEGMELAAERVKEKAKFHDMWLGTYGNLDGSLTAWSQFTRERPVISQNPKTGVFVTNRENLSAWEPYLDPKATKKTPRVVQTEAEVDALESGDTFIGPDGNEYVKP